VLVVLGGRDKENKKKNLNDKIAAVSKSGNFVSNLKNIDGTHKPKRGEVYDFIFGYSTGHVGTTTLSEAQLYGSPSNVTFLHEMHYGKYDPPDEVMDTYTWLDAKYAEEYAYVKNVYVPWMIKSRSKKASTLLDLGHNINYFARALIKYLTEETKFKFIFVRVQRERLEAAISLSYRHPDEPNDDLCEMLVTRFCPLDRPEDVILKIPGGNEVWNNFSTIQKALWITDETEARWQQLKREFTNMESIDVLWGKKWPLSLEISALQIARLFGVQTIVPFDPNWDHMEVCICVYKYACIQPLPKYYTYQHTHSPHHKNRQQQQQQEHVHAGDYSDQNYINYEVAVQDKIYQKAMRYPFTF